MIFSEPMAALIWQGRKTQTRRLVGEVRQGVRRGRTIVRRPFIPAAGKSYSVQLGRGKPTEFRITTTAVRQETLGKIAGRDNYADVRAEGFPHLLAFVRYWLQLHDRGWPRERVPCPRCMLDADYPADELPPCPECGGDAEIPFQPTPTDTEALARFTARWADRLVWVITFEVDRTASVLQLGRGVPRFLAAHSDEIYTTSPAQALEEGDDAPAEAVDPEIVDGWADTSARAHEERYLQQIALDLKLRAREDVLTRARRAAQLKGIDLAGEFRALEQLKRRKAPEQAIERAVTSIVQKVRARVAA